ncbi:hypothetical protein GCT13_35905 [Paraburkholderia sp. CNPSo 3157]|uniref:Uncharacterized protein n=1 Tax=Paraburkholderia franconis TaxID=2654983 RepID=A0A7X1NHL7_9BURK|nr:hypothetical protein [Paraburkholderia franconis]
MRCTPNIRERPANDEHTASGAIGPAGLSAAIRLKQLAQEKGVAIGVCVLDRARRSGTMCSWDASERC